MGDEGLSKGDVHIDLNEFSLGDIRGNFFNLMQGEGDMLNGLLDTVESEIGFAEVVVR